MRYDVTFQLAGEQHTDHVDAADAASAAQMVQQRHGQSTEMFELISVQLLDEMPSAASETASTLESMPR